MKVQGFFLIDTDGVALNNAGKDTRSNNENAIATKGVFKHRQRYVYVAGQALGAWWRKTLQTDFGWDLSPILTDEKVAFTSANPFLYPDDDIFGYMKAAKDFVVDGEGEIQKDSKGKEKTENVTVTRVAPLRKSILVSVGPVSAARNFSTMSRQDGNPLPYIKEEYSCVMKNQFSIDTFWVGRFSSYNKTGFRNIADKQKEEYLAKGCYELDDPYMVNAKGLPHKLVSMPDKVRLQRIKDTLKALPVLSGGAMQTNNMADITPKLLILALTTSGNHPFGNIVTDNSAKLSMGEQVQENDAENGEGTEKNQSNAKSDYKVRLDIEALKEVLKDYKDQFKGTVYIGKRAGFWDEYTSAFKELQNLGDDYPEIKFGTIVEVTNQFCDQLIEYIK